MSTRIAFDVDGCLVDFNDNPRQEVIDLLIAHHSVGCDITVWSGGGEHYAIRWVAKLNLEKYVSELICKPRITPQSKKNLHKRYDIAYDDEYVCFAKVNIKV